MLRAWRPSDCLSVTLVDCDIQCNKKQWSTNDRIGRCRGNLRDEADPDHNILRSRILLRVTTEVSKNVRFCSSAAFNGSHVALSQQVLSFLVFAMVGRMHLHSDVCTPWRLAPLLVVNGIIVISQTDPATINRRAFSAAEKSVWNSLPEGSGPFFSISGCAPKVTEDGTILCGLIPTNKLTNCTSLFALYRDREVFGLMLFHAKMKTVLLTIANLAN